MKTDAGLQGLNARQQNREVRGAERMADIDQIFDAERLVRAV